MSQPVEACPSCGETDGICFTASGELFRIYCALCGFSTKPHRDLDAARVEWWLSRKRPTG